MTPRLRTTNTSEMAADLLQALAAVQERIGPELHTDSEISDHWATVETFCAVALRVMAKTNPSKVRDEARTCEIGWLIKQNTNNQGTK